MPKTQAQYVVVAMGNERDNLRGKGPFRKWRDEFLQACIIDGMVKTGNGSVRLACDPAWEGRCLAMAPCNVCKFMPRIKAPSLGLYGSQSTTFLPSVVRKLRAQVPHVVIKRFEETGHFVPMEQPNKSVEVILHFLNEMGII